MVTLVSEDTKSVRVIEFHQIINLLDPHPTPCQPGLQKHCFIGLLVPSISIQEPLEEPPQSLSSTQSSVGE